MKRAQIHVSYAIRTEGGLLPVDLLQSIQDKKTTLDGLKPEQYHLVGEKINDAIGRAWNRALALWDSFNQARAGLPEGDLGTSVTRDKWLLPLFAELGYGRLQPAKAFEINGKVFPISHVWQKVPIHTLGCKLELDHRTEGARGASRSIPHSMLQEFLNNNDDFLWGILTNGLKLRLLRDSVSLTRQAYLEFDLEAIMEGELFADFAIFWLLCHQSRLEAEKPSDFWLEKWSKSAKDIGTRALDQLRGGVETAISELGRGFLRHPANQDLRKKLRDGVLSKEEYYRQLLRLVYRFIFFCVAEERDVLLSPSTTQAQKEKYYQYYAVGRLRRIAEKIRGSNHGDLYESFRLLCQLVSDRGLPELGLNPLGSFLFSANTAPDVESCKISNKDFLKAVYALSAITENNVVRHVDYKSLRSEELGSVYEALLELHPDLNIETSDFSLRTVAGSERKTTGSYYTPDSLVQCLLDSALEPVIAERIKGKSKQDAEKIILSLKVCDPACGSGHFLIGAAHRIAKRLAAVRSGELEPSPQESRKALRDIITHCLYGVDINPMSVELCKLALWMEALDSGKPLSFLEHRIKCGNSLIGATPKLISGGIPDGAFAPIEGDDKKYCSTYKKRNKDEVRQGGLFDQSGGVWSITRDLGKASYQVGELTNETFAEVKIQENKYKEVLASEAYKTSRFISDSWCAAFVIDKSGRLEFPITNDVLLHLKADSEQIPAWLKLEIENLAKEYQFFHWHIEFPEVFPLPQEGECPSNENAGWSGGFDCVLGNPPWEKTTILEQEFFGDIPEIVSEQRANKRRTIIDAVLAKDSALKNKWNAATRKSNAFELFLKGSARFPLTAVRELNLFPVFSELAYQIANSAGEVGIIVKSSLLVSPTWAGFTAELAQKKRLKSAFDFRNWNGWFPGIGFHERFTLLTISSKPCERVQLGFYLDDPSEIAGEKAFDLISEDLILLNPVTKTLPVFNSKRSQAITVRAYKQMPILLPGVSDWAAVYTSGFHMKSDAELLSTKEELCKDGGEITTDRQIVSKKGTYFPMLEGKLIHQYDPRFASFEGIPAENRFGKKAGTNKPTSTTKRSPTYNIEPRYWVKSDAVLKNLGNRHLLLDYSFCFRDTTNVISNFRTAVGCISSGYCFNYKAPNISFGGEDSARKMLVFLSVFNSVPFDFILRQKFFGANLIQSILYQLPCPKYSDLQKDYTFIAPRAIELSYTFSNLSRFAQECGFDCAPFTYDDARRFILQSELDAFYFLKYGLSHDDVAYVLDTFPILKEKDIEKYGAYRTKTTILEIYADMAEATKTGMPYKTRLNPPAADPSVAHKA